MTPPKSQLIIFGGLPGVGKTTIAKNLAAKLQAVYLRIDTIEEALRQTAVKPEKKFTGPEGYVTAFAIAKDNLLNSCTVIADSVNPVEITRR